MEALREQHYGPSDRDDERADEARSAWAKIREAFEQLGARIDLEHERRRSVDPSSLDAGQCRRCGFMTCSCLGAPEKYAIAGVWNRLRPDQLQQLDASRVVFAAAENGGVPADPRPTVAELRALHDDGEDCAVCGRERYPDSSRRGSES